jgi:hypothetical protein
VLITRCAWHRGYHGHPAFIGVTDWRGLRLGFSDGICSRCAEQLRADIPGSFLTDRRSATDVAGWLPGVGLVTIAVMAIVLFAARPVHEPAEDQKIAELKATRRPDSGDEPTTAALPRAAAHAPRTPSVVARRAVGPRSAPSLNRRASPRGSIPARTRAGSEAMPANRTPSQSP